MEENRFLISETAKKVEVESHVLRYWEEELDLPIHRNELGHRYYTREDIERFKEIKRLKENGLQLRAIRMVLYSEKKDTSVNQRETMPSQSTLLFDEKKDTVMPCNPSREEKAFRLQMLLKNMIAEAVRESNSGMVDEIKDSIVKELDYQFRILGEEEEKRSIEQQKQQEEHFRKLDESLRSTVKGKEKRKKHSLF